MRSETAAQHKGDDMSKFLKFIVNLFLTLAIVVTAGIIVPPLLGVNTTIVDTAGMDTNLPLGSVTYSRDKAVMELVAGDEILKESGSATYAYIVQEGDAATGEFTVVSATEPGASPETVILRNSVSEVVLTIPYIGFVVVAMQSLEGRIIIALVILFIIILFILSELWKKRDDDEDEDDDDSGDLGNVQTASAEKAGDAGRSGSGTAGSAGYSENVKDNRGYGTVSQDTASIAAAMVGLESVAGSREKAEAYGAGETSSQDISADKELSNNTDEDKLPVVQMPVETVPEEPEWNVPVEDRQKAALASQAKNTNAMPVDDVNAQIPIGETEVPEISGDTKVFPGSFASQIKNVTTEPETASGNDIRPDVAREETAVAFKSSESSSGHRTEDVIEEALIAESEKAAASWGGRPAGVEPEQEPKPIWSWADEPFESELDGDSWNSFPAGSPVSANEYPERFAPVERMTRQEIIEQAKSGGNEPKIQRDEVTGIDIIDYSDLL